MYTKSTGIIFRTLKYSESSLILDVYTIEKGIQSYIVSGVRKSKSRLANVFLPANIIDIVSFQKDNKLSRIKEAQLSHVYQNINLNVLHSSIAMFMIDLSRNAIKESEGNTALYSFLTDTLHTLDNQTESLAHVPIVFCLNLAKYLGFEMSNNYSTEYCHFNLKEGQFVQQFDRLYGLDAHESIVLNNYLNGDIDYNCSKADRNAVLDHLLNYFALHIEGFKSLKSISVLRTVLS